MNWFAQKPVLTSPSRNADANMFRKELMQQSVQFELDRTIFDQTD
jgi:hypothetical protein